LDNLLTVLGNLAKMWCSTWGTVCQ